MKVKHIILLSALAVIALLFVGGASAGGGVYDQSSVSSLSSLSSNSHSSSLSSINVVDSSSSAQYNANDNSQARKREALNAALAASNAKSNVPFEPKSDVTPGAAAPNKILPGDH